MGSLRSVRSEDGQKRRAAVRGYELGQRLIEAAVRGDVAEMRTLLEEGADVNARDEKGFTALLSVLRAYWLERGNAPFEAVDLLLKYGADPNAAIEEVAFTAVRMMTDLAWESADDSDHLRILMRLLENGARLTDRELLFGEFVVVKAAQFGLLEIVETLLDAGMDVNAQDNGFGATALIWSLHNQDTEMAEFLLDRGADANLTSDSVSHPLLWAVSWGNLKIIQRLLDAGADVNARCFYSGKTALMMAVASSNLEAVKLLLSHKADTILEDVHGNTALAWALESLHSPEITDYDREALREIMILLSDPERNGGVS